MGTAVFLIAAATVAFILLRWWLLTHAKTPCGWCRGTGKNRLSTKKHQGDCKHCGGSGKRRSRLLGKNDR